MPSKSNNRKVAKKSARKPETGNRYSDLQKRAARVLRRTGWKQDDIAGIFGTTQRSVREWTKDVMLLSDAPTSTAERIDRLTDRLADQVDKRLTQLEKEKDLDVGDLSAMALLLDRMRRATDGDAPAEANDPNMTVFNRIGAHISAAGKA